MSATPPLERIRGNRMADKLLKAGLLNELQLAAALREHARKGGELRHILEDLGLLNAETIASFLAEEAGTVPVDLRGKAIQPEVLKLIPYELAKRCRAIPLEANRETSTLEVAIADPFDVAAIDTMGEAAGMKIKVLTAPEKEIAGAIMDHYLARRSIENTIQELLTRSADSSFEEAIMSDPPLIRLVEQMLTHAVESGASDIHVEPDEKILRVRIRVDGILQEYLLIPKTLQAAITARLKIIGKMDLTETRVPLDGRATFQAGRHEVNLRISSLPTAFGENVVLRLLDRSNMNLKFTELGLGELDLKKLKKALDRAYGVILVTGPTGSGKTTTLYSILSQMNVLQRSIYTLEDPIEYRLPVIRQTQINEDLGMTFAKGLRALLRQDPNVILVGETRDSETAELMVRAALAGHLVFSTLHTNDAAGAIPRLLDMGIEPYLLPTVLEAVLAQRLVRTICKHCKELGEETGQTFDELEIDIPPGAPERLWHGAGCDRCRGTGYKGRIGLFEILMMEESLGALVLKRADALQIRRRGRELGMSSMFEDGIRKVCEGKTTLQEVLRVTKLSERQKASESE